MAFEHATAKRGNEAKGIKPKDENVLYMEHGKPLIFGQNRDKGIRVIEGRPEVVELGNGITEDDLLFHDEKADSSALSFMLAQMQYPEFPDPLGVFRDVERPVYDEGVEAQMEQAKEAKGPGDLQALFNSGDTWTVS